MRINYHGVIVEEVTLKDLRQLVGNPTRKYSKRVNHHTWSKEDILFVKNNLSFPPKVLKTMNKELKKYSNSAIGNLKWKLKRGYHLSKIQKEII